MERKDSQDDRQGGRERGMPKPLKAFSLFLTIGSLYQTGRMLYDAAAAPWRREPIAETDWHRRTVDGISLNFPVELVRRPEEEVSKPTEGLKPPKYFQAQTQGGFEVIVQAYRHQGEFKLDVVGKEEELTSELARNLRLFEATFAQGARKIGGLEAGAAVGRGYRGGREMRAQFVFVSTEGRSWKVALLARNEAYAQDIERVLGSIEIDQIQEPQRGGE